MSRRRNSYQAAPKPADAETGAAAVRKFMIGLFDREDGRAANWPLIAETLFRAAFETLAEMPADARKEALLRRVHDGAYNRLVGNEGAEADSQAPLAAAPAAGEPSPLRTRDFRP